MSGRSAGATQQRDQTSAYGEGYDHPDEPGEPRDLVVEQGRARSEYGLTFLLDQTCFLIVGRSLHALSMIARCKASGVFAAKLETTTPIMSAIARPTRRK